MKQKECDEQYCDWLMDLFIRKGYNVEKERSTSLNDFSEIVEDGLYISYLITGKGIKGCFCTEHDKSSMHSSYSCLNGHFSVDHKDAFDKWTSCPMCVYLPMTKIDERNLFKHLEFLGSKNGLKHSRSFEYLDDGKAVMPRSKLVYAY